MRSVTYAAIDYHGPLQRGSHPVVHQRKSVFKHRSIDRGRSSWSVLCDVVRARPSLSCALLLCVYLPPATSGLAQQIAAPEIAAPAAAATIEIRSLGALEQSVAAELDQRILAQMQQDETVGLAIGVIRDGQLAYVKGYGLADRETNAPVTTESMFRWASISKPLTAVAGMQLYEIGKLDLDADVRRYVPEFPDFGSTITARDLLCHQSGIVHYQNGPVIVRERDYATDHPFADVITALDKFKDSPLLFQPGKRLSYSTHAYILLSAVVQRAGEQPFAQQVDQRIADVCGMASLQPDYPWVEIPGRVSGYRRFFETVVPSDSSDVSWKLGGGGFISNIEDMARFGCGLIERKLVAASTEFIMWTPQTTDTGTLTSYGLGFLVEGSGENLKVSHSGAQPKTRTLLVLYPRRRCGYAIATNSEWVRPVSYAPLLEQVLQDERAAE